MNWVFYVWAAMGGACVMMALIYFAAWFKGSRGIAYVLLSGAALSIGAISVFEMGTMGAASAQDYVELVRWAQIPISLLIALIVGFVQVRFQAGRAWMAGAVIGLCLLVLIANFALELGILYAAPPTLEQLQFYGNAVVITAQGKPSAWAILDVTRSLTYLAYLGDALFTAWRRSDPRVRGRAALVLGSILIATMAAATHAALINQGVIRGPYLITPSCLMFIAVIAYDLSVEVSRIGELAGVARLSADQLKVSNARIELAANAAEIGFWDWQPRDRKIWMSAQFRKSFGLDESGPVTVRRILGCVDPRDRRRLRQTIRRALKSEDKFSVEFRVGNEETGNRRLRMLGQSSGFVRGRPAVVRAVTIDFTPLALAEERLSRVVESSPYGIFMIDESGQVVVANAQAAALFGREREELLELRVEALMPAWRRERHAGDRQDLNRQPRAGTMEMGAPLYGLRKDGTEFPIEVWALPLQEKGRMCMLVTVADVSERRRAEGEAAARRNELMHLSRVALVGELSSALSHELNQPLAAILSNAQAAQRFLERDPSDIGEVREILADIIEADKRAGDVISRLRAMLKKDTVGYAELDMNDVVHETLRLMHSDLLNRHVTVRMDLAPALPPVKADRIQMQQILLNLIMNACDAMERLLPAERVVRVTTSLRDDSVVEVNVADRGIGIQSGQLERIFEPFMTTKPHGMGVGLSVCRTIAQSHGGAIHAFNNAERGSTFRVSIPVSRELVA